MSDQSNPLVFVYLNEDLEELTQEQTFAVGEFKQYKAISLSASTNNFVAPNEGIQFQEPSCHSLFGRDRVFEHPSHLITQIHQENLSHVHYSDGTWEEHIAQWDCTSNMAVIYSGFEHANGFHFVIHEMILKPDEDAHDFYGTQDIEYYIGSARYYREEIQNPK